MSTQSDEDEAIVTYCEKRRSCVSIQRTGEAKWYARSSTRMVYASFWRCSAVPLDSASQFSSTFDKHGDDVRS